MKRRRYLSGLFVGRRKRRHEVDFVHLKGRGDRFCCCKVTVVDGIESPADYGNPHDPCLTSSAAESFMNTCCFNSSRPSPVTDEILIIWTALCLHQRCSFRTFSGIATSIFVATTIVGFSGSSELCSASSARIALYSVTGSCSLDPDTSTRCSRSLQRSMWRRNCSPSP